MFVTVNSPFTVLLLNQVQQLEQVAQIGLILPGSVGWQCQLATKAAGGIKVPSPSMTVRLRQVSRQKIQFPRVDIA
jgi:hypothetical protein